MVPQRYGCDGARWRAGAVGRTGRRDKLSGFGQHGVLVTGELGDVSAYAERLGRHDSSVVCPTVRNIADAAGATALTVLSASYGQYIQLSERSINLFRAHGATPAEPGDVFWVGLQGFGHLLGTSVRLRDAHVYTGMRQRKWSPINTDVSIARLAGLCGSRFFMERRPSQNRCPRCLPTCSVLTETTYNASSRDSLHLPHQEIASPSVPSPSRLFGRRGDDTPLRHRQLRAHRPSRRRPRHATAIAGGASVRPRPASSPTQDHAETDSHTISAGVPVARDSRGVRALHEEVGLTRLWARPVASR